MARNGEHQIELVMVPPEFWSLLQATLSTAIGWCNDLASAVEAHQRLGLYDAEKLLDDCNGKVREIRKLLEAVEVPF